MQEAGKRGWQKQRVSSCRAMLANNPVLVTAAQLPVWNNMKSRVWAARGALER
jgi:hypothetical protein